MSDLDDDVRQLEERFGRPLTAEERSHLHEAHAGSTDAAEPAASPYGSVRRAGPVTHPGARPAAPGATPTAPAPPATPLGRLRARLRRLATPIVAGAVAIGKWSALIFKLKFLGLFISIGAFQFLWRSWWLAIGFVGLILIHELGHMAEAKRQGLAVTWPQFVPFLGAYVRLKDLPKSAWDAALVGLAGPVVGSAAAVACWGAAEASGSVTLKALAHLGLWINLFNLIPIGFLDGHRVVDALEPRAWLGVIALLGIVAAVLHNGLLIIALIIGAVEVWSRFKRIDERARNPYYAIGHGKMAAIALAYVGLAALLVAGMAATNVPR